MFLLDGERIEVEAVSGYQVLPKGGPLRRLEAIKLFNKWSYEDVEIRGHLFDAITSKSEHQSISLTPPGRYAQKRFRKANCPIIERLTNSLMMNGRNNGKKLMAVRIVAHAFEIIHIMTDQNPIQILPVSDLPVPSVVKPSMSPLSAVSTKLSLSLPSVPVKLHSETSSPLLSAWPKN
ncbi:hypothetical protein MFRU_028g00040 [Monilinia fructicola]|nr:hypothetical protein MFRU_028g00040 [Monilinia fructicola]